MLNTFQTGSKLNAITVSHEGQDTNVWIGAGLQGYYSRWDKDISLDDIVHIPALVRQLTYYVMDKVFNNLSIPYLKYDKERRRLWDATRHFSDGERKAVSLYLYPHGGSPEEAPYKEAKEMYDQLSDIELQSVWHFMDLFPLSHRDRASEIKQDGDFRSSVCLRYGEDYSFLEASCHKELVALYPAFLANVYTPQAEALLKDLSNYFQKYITPRLQRGYTP